MRMDNPNKCITTQSACHYDYIIDIGALTIDPLLVVTTGEVEDSEENRNVDSSISNGNNLFSSSPLPSQSSQRSMNTDITGSRQVAMRIDLLNLLCRIRIRVTSGRNHKTPLRVTLSYISRFKHLFIVIAIINSSQYQDWCLVLSLSNSEGL